MLAGGSAVDQPGRDGLAGQFGAPVVEAREEVGCDGLAGLDFDGMDGVRGGFDEGGLRAPVGKFKCAAIPDEGHSSADTALGISQ